MKDFFDWKAPDTTRNSIESQVEVEGPKAFGGLRAEYRKRYCIPLTPVDYEEYHNNRRRNWVKGADAPIRDIIHGLQPHAAYNRKKQRRFCFNGTRITADANLEELIRKCAYGMRDPMIGAIETAVYGSKTNKTFDAFFAQFDNDFYDITKDKYIEFPYIVGKSPAYDAHIYGVDSSARALRCGKIPQSMFNSIYFFDGYVYDEKRKKRYNPAYQLVRVGDYFIMPLTVEQSHEPRSQKIKGGESKLFTLSYKGCEFTFSLMEELWLLSELIRTPKKKWPEYKEMMKIIHYQSGDESDLTRWASRVAEESLYMIFLKAHRCIRPDDTVANLAFEMFPEKKSGVNCLLYHPFATTFTLFFCVANLFMPWWIINPDEGNIVMWASLIACGGTLLCRICLEMMDKHRRSADIISDTIIFLLAYSFGAIYRFSTGINLVVAIQALFWLFSILVGLIAPLVGLWLLFDILLKEPNELDKFYYPNLRRIDRRVKTQARRACKEKYLNAI